MPRTEVDLWNVALALVGDFAIVLEGTKTASSATAANPVVVTSASHGYSSGDRVLLRDFDQMTQVNGRVFEIDVVNANSFRLVGEDGTGYTAETTGGTVARLPSARYVAQVALQWPFARDEVLRAHPWNCAEKKTRLARLQAPKTVTGASAANPVVITAAAHGYSSGDLVLLENLGGMVELNSRYFGVTVLTSSTFSLNGEDGTTYTAYTSGGTAKKALTPLKPDFGYAYRYSLPSDYIRELEAEDSREGWQVVGQEVHSDDGPTLPMRYIYRLTDPAVYDSLLAQTLAARLALDISMRLSEPSSSKREDLRRGYELLLREARMVDAQEASVNAPPADDWELARL